MTPEESIYRYRLRTLALADEIGSVRPAINQESEQPRSKLRQLKQSIKSAATGQDQE